MIKAIFGFVALALAPVLSFAAGGNENFQNSANEIRAIISSPGVEIEIGDREITEIRYLGNGGYTLVARGCELKIQIGYERPVYPPEPSVHINSAVCK